MNAETGSRKNISSFCRVPSFRQDLEEHVGALVPAETPDWLRKGLPGPVLVCH